MKLTLNCRFSGCSQLPSSWISSWMGNTLHTYWVPRGSFHLHITQHYLPLPQLSLLDADPNLLLGVPGWLVLVKDLVHVLIKFHSAVNFMHYLIMWKTTTLIHVKTLCVMWLKSTCIYYYKRISIHHTEILCLVFFQWWKGDSKKDNVQYDYFFCGHLFSGTC